MREYKREQAFDNNKYARTISRRPSVMRFAGNSSTGAQRGAVVIRRYTLKHGVRGGDARYARKALSHSRDAF